MTNSATPFEHAVDEHLRQHPQDPQDPQEHSLPGSIIEPLQVVGSSSHLGEAEFLKTNLGLFVAVINGDNWSPCGESERPAGESPAGLPSPRSGRAQSDYTKLCSGCLTALDRPGQPVPVEPEGEGQGDERSTAPDVRPLVPILRIRL